MFNRGGYWTYEVTGVEGHDNLLFHKGNTEADSEGCVLVAEAYDPIGGIPGISSSANGFGEFMARCGEVPEFDLLVSDWRTG